MVKYAVRLNNETNKKEFIQFLRSKDDDFELDNESNRVTVWVTTSLSESELLEIQGVEDVVKSLEKKV